MNPEREWEQYTRIAQSVVPQAKRVRTWTLHGGISARMTALEVETTDGECTRMVVRELLGAGQQGDPAAAPREYHLLQALHAANLPVPVPYALDESKTILPDPFLVISYLDGVPDYAPIDRQGYVAQMAMQLARLHRLDTTPASWQPVLDGLPRQSLQAKKMLATAPIVSPVDASIGSQLRALLEPVLPDLSRNKPILLHGDFWPGNILWRTGELVGVVDWEDAAVGDALADLAISRLDVLWILGGDAMDALTSHYQTLMPEWDYTLLPYWDLYAALRSLGWLDAAAAGWAMRGRPDITEQTMRADHAQFVASAIARLATGSL